MVSLPATSIFVNPVNSPRSSKSPYLSRRPRASARLGTHTSTRNPPVSTPAKTDPAMLRIRRFALQDAAREILRDEYRTDKNGQKQHKFRVCFCCRSRRARVDVQIRRSKTGSHHYANLALCGSVWTCPICGSIISERRRAEIQSAVQRWTARPGHTVLMLTQTVPHYQSDSIDYVRTGFQKARRLQRNRKSWKRWSDRYVGGIITAVDLTYGDNGWHIHSHEILFLKPAFLFDRDLYRKNNPAEYTIARKIGAIDPFLELNRCKLHQMWSSAVVSAGLPEPSLEHGVDLSDSDSVGDYVSKWGIDCELTKAHLKEGRKGGRTPWAILSDFLENGDMQDAYLFRAFAYGFFGRNQLFWSRGLKKELCIDEKTDDEILTESESGVECVTMTVEQWRAVLYHQQRGHVLEMANTGGYVCTRDYILWLTDKFKCRERQTSDACLERQRLIRRRWKNECQGQPL